MITQLNPPIPLDTPKGPGLCHVLIDYGPESHLYWVVILDSNGEIWTFANLEVRGQSNPTMGRLVHRDLEQFSDPSTDAIPKIVQQVDQMLREEQMRKAGTRGTPLT